MLVYGDRARTVAPRQALRTLTASLRQAETAPAGPARHDLFIRAFLEASELAQGIADAAFEATGEDGNSPAQDAAMALLLTLARKVAASAWSGFAQTGPASSAELMALALSPLPERISVKTPEGYAFYALYPEAYLKAAAERPWSAPPFVIGLRSIGTGLAALVAAVTGASGVATLRPVGHPFRREVRVSSALREQFARHNGPFALVDEGPGLSGSSFAAAAELLNSLGVSEDRVVFLPSHDHGPGPQADPDFRRRWEGAERRPATFEALIEDEPLPGWFEDLTGPIHAIEDLSGGAWASGRNDAPGVNSGQERRKYRLTTRDGVWLAKFAGLGPVGAAKLARARTLGAAGLTPEPLGLRRGFLVERWVSAEPGLRGNRARLIEQVGGYLGLRALAFPAEAAEGADLAELDTMMRANVSELLGAGAASALPRPPPVSAPPHPIHVDGRLHRWEWLTRPDGTVVKTDAVDHGCGHDLVGCQDVAWDVAGARAELDLSGLETAQLCRAIAQVCDRPVDLDLLAFLEPAYLAFQAGLWTMAGQPAEVARYAARLAASGAAASRP